MGGSDGQWLLDTCQSATARKAGSRGSDLPEADDQAALHYRGKADKQPEDAPDDVGDAADDPEEVDDADAFTGWILETTREPSTMV